MSKQPAANGDDGHDRHPSGEVGDAPGVDRVEQQSDVASESGVVPSHQVDDGTGSKHIIDVDSSGEDSTAMAAGGAHERSSVQDESEHAVASGDASFGTATTPADAGGASATAPTASEDGDAARRSSAQDESVSPVVSSGGTDSGGHSTTSDASAVAGANAIASLGDPAPSQANESIAVPKASAIDGGPSAARGASQSTGDATHNQGVSHTVDEDVTAADGEVSDGALNQLSNEDSASAVVGSQDPVEVLSLIHI